MESDLARVVVVGTSGCGKTTFARRLAAALGAPHVELDSLFWRPAWQERPRAEFQALVRDAAAGERWVIDGNYSSVRELVWPRATAIVWLDYSFPRVLGRVLSRTVRRAVTREELWGGNRESFRQSFFSRDSIVLWMLTTFRRRRREYGALRARYPFVVLDSPRAARRFAGAAGVR